MNTNSETMKLAACALSRLASRLEERHCDLFVQELQSFDNFEYVIKEIAKITNKEQDVQKSKNENEQVAEFEPPIQLKKIEQDVLKYLLNVLENITSVKITRDVLDCARLYQSVIKLINPSLTLEHLISLINIIFNLNFNLSEPT